MNRETYDLAALHPVMKIPAMTLAAEMGTRRFKLEDGRQGFLAPFEGFRHPLRQHYLLTRAKSTKAGPWQSAHQYGMAMDFAGRFVDEQGNVLVNSWNWDDVPESAWVELKRRAAIVGLDVPIAWDKGHVEHPRWRAVRAAAK